MKKMKTAVGMIMAMVMLFSINLYAADNSNFLEGYQTEPDIDGLIAYLERKIKK